MQALLAAKEGCCLLLRTFQMSQEGVAEFAMISRNGRPVIPAVVAAHRRVAAERDNNTDLGP